MSLLRWVSDWTIPFSAREASLPTHVIGAKRPSCGGSPRKGARSAAEQRLAAGGPQGSPDPQPTARTTNRSTPLRPAALQLQVYLTRFRFRIEARARHRRRPRVSGGTHADDAFNALPLQAPLRHGEVAERVAREYS